MRVGHRQALNKETPVGKPTGVFYLYPSESDLLGGEWGEWGIRVAKLRAHERLLAVLTDRTIVRL